MWLPRENKFARKSLRSRCEAMAIKKGEAAYVEIYANLQQGKTYFSITTKEGVEKCLSSRMRDVELGHIVKVRHTTISTHLQYFLSFIGKDTKLKELERTDCDNHLHHRHKANNGNVNRVTVQNEQSTIYALMKWLPENGKTHIDGLDFKKLLGLDKANEAFRRLTLTNEKYEALYLAMRNYTAKHNKLDDAELRVRKTEQHCVLIAANSGLRVGEQEQLCWIDVQIERHKLNGEEQKNERTTALKEVKRRCGEFGFAAGMLRGSLAGGQKKNAS